MGFGRCGDREARDACLSHCHLDVVAECWVSSYLTTVIVKDKYNPQVTEFFKTAQRGS